jgi:hypothetical protein
MHMEHTEEGIQHRKNPNILNTKYKSSAVSTQASDMPAIW